MNLQSERTPGRTSPRGVEELQRLPRPANVRRIKTTPPAHPHWRHDDHDDHDHDDHDDHHDDDDGDYDCDYDCGYDSGGDERVDDDADNGDDDDDDDGDDDDGDDNGDDGDDDHDDDDIDHVGDDGVNDEETTTATTVMTTTTTQRNDRTADAVWKLPIAAAPFGPHKQVRHPHSREKSYNKIHKTIVFNDLPKGTPTGGPLSDIRLSMLATRAGVHQGHVIDMSSLGLCAPLQH